MRKNIYFRNAAVSISERGKRAAEKNQVNFSDIEIGILDAMLGNYSKAWALRDPLLIESTPTSVVYKVRAGDALAALKILSPLGQRDEADGAAALLYFNGCGAVRLLRFDAQAQLLAFVDGRILKDLCVAGRDQDATLITCGVLKQLHSNRATAAPSLKTLAELFSGFLNHASSSSDSLLRESAEVASQLLGSEREKVVLHGDIHHKNILEATDGEWLAIDPKGYFGERSFDLANFFYNPDDRPLLVKTSRRIEEVAAIFSRELQIERTRILKFAFAFGGLSSYWAMQDGQNPSRRLRIASLIRQLM